MIWPTPSHVVQLILALQFHMNFLERFLSLDPTRDWPVECSFPVGFDVERGAFGPLAFGDPVVAARFLGRPSSFERTSSDSCMLQYARSGFEIEFDTNRFSYIAFFIGPDEYLPTHPELRFSRPQVDADFVLVPDTTVAQLQGRFGLPESVDADQDETVLFYSLTCLTMEFEFDAAGPLKRWNLYPK